MGTLLGVHPIVPWMKSKLLPFLMNVLLIFVLLIQIHYTAVGMLLHGKRTPFKHFQMGRFRFAQPLNFRSDGNPLQVIHFESSHAALWFDRDRDRSWSTLHPKIQQKQWNTWNLKLFASQKSPLGIMIFRFMTLNLGWLSSCIPKIVYPQAPRILWTRSM